MHAHTADSAVCLHAHMHCVIGTATTVHPALSLSAPLRTCVGLSLELNISLRPWSIDLYSLSLRSNKDSTWIF
jgi:hypothetical protein